TAMGLLGERGGRAAWHALVPVTALVAGLLFATSAHTAKGTDLRGGRFSQLTDLITAAQAGVATQERQAATLRRDVAEASRRAALAAEPGVDLFRQYVDAFGLTYDVRSASLRMPAYSGTLDLPHVVGG